PCGQRILSPSRLPFRHSGRMFASRAYDGETGRSRAIALEPRVVDSLADCATEKGSAFLYEKDALRRFHF
ncbi:MAG: hypothetical protein WCR23_08365, partial [Planctomycetota bacterium]